MMMSSLDFHCMPLFIVGMTVTIVVVFVCGVCVSRPNSVNQVAHLYGVMLSFFNMLWYSLAIVQSYQLAQQIGQDATYSGKMIGTYMSGVALGACFIWLAARQHPTLWKDQPRSLLVIAQLCIACGAVGYMLVAAAADAILWPSPLHLPLRQCPLVLLCARFTAGLGAGMCTQLVQSSVPLLNERSELPEKTSQVFLASMLGIGFGPPVASSLIWLNRVVDADGPRFVYVGMMQLSGSLCVALVMMVLYPDLGNVQDFKYDTVQQLLETHKISTRRWLIFSCIIMNCTRAFVISGLEVATALLLENAYNWQRRHIGVAIGCAFLCCIPVKLFHVYFKESITPVAFIRLSSCLAWLSSFLLFSFNCTLLHFGDSEACPTGLILILADMVIFPSLYISDGLNTGMMQKYLFPVGSLLDANHVTLYLGLISNGVGRYAGPYVARWRVQQGGQDYYALQQLAAIMLFLIMFEASVKPSMLAIDAAREEDPE